MTTTDRPRLTAILVLATLLSAACGGGGGGGGPAPSGGNGGGGGGGGGTTTYSVSVTVSGLSGSTLVLQDNGSSTLSFTTNATQTFANKLASGAAYAVTVLTQPGAQECSVTGGSGTVGKANVSVAVSCAALVNYWTWIGGINGIDQAGSYGNKGTAAVGNFPGGRRLATTWTDASGNLWLFGGEGLDSMGTSGYLNDLWEYSGGLWTWVSGSNTVLGAPVFGSQGQAAAGYTPGARLGAISWTDTAGTLWLFGGSGYDSNNSASILNDLWKFSGGQWAWVGGMTTGNSAGLYGTQGLLGQSATTSFPGARYSAASWFDTSGNLWLFGGFGYGATSAFGALNDLWEFDGSSWTFVSGPTSPNTPMTGFPAPRDQASAWLDKTAGNLYLFGGDANTVDSEATNFCLSDLWKFSGTISSGTITGTWTFVGGATTQDTPGTYGTKDVAAPSNMPGARFSANAWVDQAGKLWLFGGIGYDSAGANYLLNDVWNYDISTGLWTWTSGATTADTPGTYGTLNVPSLKNSPGARAGASSWIDSAGTVWLFGGSGFDGAGASSYLNDYWHFEQ